MSGRKLSKIFLAASLFVMITNPALLTSVSHISIFPSFLGIQCPGCGVTSGIIAILHGSWVEAWTHNPASFLVLAYLFLIGIKLSIKDLRVEKIAKWFGHLTLIALLTIFCIRLIN